MRPIFLSAHMCFFCIFFYSFTVLKDPWPCLTLERSTTKEVIVLSLEKDNACLSSLGAVGGCKRYTVIVLCTDQRWLLHAVSPSRSLTVKEKSVLFCDKSTSLTINYTHVCPAVFSGFFFSQHWHIVKNVVFHWLCKWNVLLPLNYGTSCPQKKFCKCRAVNCGW